MKKLFLLLVLFSITVNAQTFPFWWDGNGSGGGSSSYSEEALVYFRQLDPIPGDTTLGTGGTGNDTLDAIAKFIDSINVHYAIYDSLDEMWLFAINTETNGYQGIKGYKDCSEVGSVAFVAYEGITGGTSNYLNTNWNPVTDGINYSLNDASYGIYSRTDIDLNQRDIGANVAATNSRAYIRLETSTGAVEYGINVNSATSVSNGGNTQGFFIVTRAASNADSLYRNGTMITSGVTSSSAMPNFNFYICAANNNGTAGNFSTKQFAFAFVGGYLTAAASAYFSEKLEELLDFFGAGVVP